MADNAKKVIELNAELSILHKLKSEESDATKIASLKTEIQAKGNELLQLAVESANSQITDPSSLSFVDTYQRAQMIASHVAGLPKFNGNSSDEVANFVTRLRQLKITYSINDSDAIGYGKAKLAPNPFRSLENYEKINGEITSFDMFCSYFKENYGAFHSAYQTLEHCFSLNRKSNDSWTQFNQTLTQQIAKVKNSHSELMKSKNKTVSVDTVFDLLQNAILLANINQANTDLYRQITCEAKDLISPNILASRASTLETQGNFNNGASHVFFGQKNTNKGGSFSYSKDEKEHEKGKPNYKGKKTGGKKKFFKGNKTLGPRQEFRGDYSRKPQRQEPADARTQANYFASEDWSLQVPDASAVAPNISGAKNSM